MKQYTDVRSTVKPNSIEIKPEKVYTYTNIREEAETIEDVKTTMYVYDMTEYGKDEFISELFTQVGESQQAIADLYENVG